MALFALVVMRAVVAEVSPDKPLTVLFALVVLHPVVAVLNPDKPLMALFALVVMRAVVEAVSPDNPRTALFALVVPHDVATSDLCVRGPGHHCACVVSPPFRPSADHPPPEAADRASRGARSGVTVFVHSN